MYENRSLEEPEIKEKIEEDIRRFTDEILPLSNTKILGTLRDRFALGDVNHYAFFIWYSKIKKLIAELGKEFENELDLAKRNLGEKIKKENPITWYGVDIQRGVTNSYVDLKDVTDLEYKQLLKIKKEVDERIKAKEAYYKEVAQTTIRSKQNNPFVIDSDKKITITASVPYLSFRKEDVTVQIPPYREVVGLKLTHN
jgi:hypothetical protein